MNSVLKEKIKEVPHSPGCYKYFNKKGELIYIGKAKDLNKRVSSYFVKTHQDLKTPVLVENIADIKWEVTGSEIEALVLESLLIKKYKPRFNIKIKDDKDFLWVKIDLKQEFPTPELVRRPNVSAGGKTPPVRDGARLFGPFTDPKLLKQGLTVLRKIFLWRDCSASKFSFHKKREKPCLEYYIKNCSAPCITDNHYQLGIKQLIAFLNGNKKGLVKIFRKEMTNLAEEKRFEEAGIIRDKLKALEHMDASLSFKSQITNNKQISNSKSQISKDLILVLNKELGYKLKFKKDFRIEFYDISNTSGSEAVGSMVVWQDGKFAKDQYRKFKIKFVRGPNDVEMMRETLARRMARMSNIKFPISNKAQISNVKRDESFSKRPDLIVLDGGKPQLGGVGKLFQQLNIDIPLISLAKQEEEVFGIKSYKAIRFIKLNIKKSSPEGFFVQRLRDEAHRFAIGYHKILREKKMIRSGLDEIEGVGPAKKKKLLLKFGSVDGIMKADIGGIANVVGNRLAIEIKENLK